MNGFAFLCKVTEEAKVEIELQKERRVEGFQRQVILLEIQYFVWLQYLSSWRKKCVNLEKCRQLQQLAELEIKHARYVGHSSVMGEMRIRFSCVTFSCVTFSLTFSFVTFSFLLLSGHTVKCSGRHWHLWEQRNRISRRGTIILRGRLGSFCLNAPLAPRQGCLF